VILERAKGFEPSTPALAMSLAKKPTIIMSALKQQIEKEYGRDFHFSYLRKLVGKVPNEISHGIDTAKIEPRLVEPREI
jgi:hypothetical protein